MFICSCYSSPNEYNGLHEQTYHQSNVELEGILHDILLPFLLICLTVNIIYSYSNIKRIFLYERLSLMIPDSHIILSVTQHSLKYVKLSVFAYRLLNFSPFNGKNKGRGWLTQCVNQVEEKQQYSKIESISNAVQLKALHRRCKQFTCN